MTQAQYKLYHYWRSSCSWRVRWGMRYKNIPFHTIAVGLLNGESESEAHLKRNPAGFVPVLETPDGEMLTESLAILRYLEEVYPDPPILPNQPLDRARCWALAEVINAGTQPLQNIPAMSRHSSDPQEQKKWAQHFIHQGLETFEMLVQSNLQDSSKKFSCGDALTIADLCLIPQIYNARRFEVPLTAFPRITQIYENCSQLPSFQQSHPDQFDPDPAGP